MIDERPLPAIGPADAIDKRVLQMRADAALERVGDSVRRVIREYITALEHGIMADYDRWCRLHEAELLAPEDAVDSASDGTIGILTVRNLRPGVPAEVRRHLRALLDAGARSILLDLRGNAGSTPEDATLLASEFLLAGQPVVTVRGVDNRTLSSVEGGLATDPSMAVVVCQDRFTASGAEVVTAALRYYKRATIVGEHSFGKSWTWRRTPDGSEIKTGDWLDPAGRSVNPRGVLPDVPVDGQRALAVAIERLR